MRLDVYYFGWDFFNCCLHLNCCKLKHNVSAAVSSGLPQVSLLYLDIEMIQPGKSFLMFDCCDSTNNNKNEDISPKKITLFLNALFDQQSNFKNDFPG